MQKSSWEKRFSKLVLTTHSLYGTALATIGIIYLLLPPEPEYWNPKLHPMIFVGLVSIAAGSFFLAVWMYAQLMSFSSLEMRRKGIGFKAAIDSFSSGIVLSVCLGDMCATLGVAFYAISREPNRLWIFLGFWGLHYIFATVWLRKGREDLEHLFQQEAMMSNDSIKSVV